MDQNESNDVEARMRAEAESSRDVASGGIPWGAALLLVWAVMLVVFSVQNAEIATVSFLGWSWDMPVALLVMVTALVTLVLSVIVSAFYRRRRRQRREVRRAERSGD